MVGGVELSSCALVVVHGVTTLVQLGYTVCRLVVLLVFQIATGSVVFYRLDRYTRIVVRGLLRLHPSQDGGTDESFCMSRSLGRCFAE